MRNKYICCELVEAEEMTWDEYREYSGIKNEFHIQKDGYLLIYKNGRTCWRDKDFFEKNHVSLLANPKLPIDINIGSEMVDKFIKEVNVSTIGEKTTLVRVVLANGFELVESSSCVSLDNYSEEIGKEICMEKIKDEIWYLLGFILQTACTDMQ